jgi:RNA polymerase sigma factor (sigma-70 family)
LLRPRLIEVGRRFFGSDLAAEDIAQETLMRLWLLRERIDPRTGMEALAIRIAKNLCVSEWRKGNVRKSTILQQEPHSEDVTIRQLEAREDIERLRAAIQRLSPTEQRLFRMRHELEMDIGQIAAATGATTRSISAMLSTAKRKLLDLLNPKGERQ